MATASKCPRLAIHIPLNNSFARLRLCVSFLAVAVFLVIGGRTWGEETSAGDTAPAAPQTSAAGDELSVEQARLADRYKRLEEVFGRLAELSASTDPRRAKLLREAIALSREQDINLRFASVVKLLEEERLSAAATNQTELHKELDLLLSLLLKADRDKELASQRERVRKYLRELARLIRVQRGIRARTEGDDELRGLREDQGRLADETGKLGGEITKTEVDKGDKEADAGKDGKDGKSDEPESKQSDGEGEKSGEPSKSDGSKSGSPSKGEPSEGQRSPPGESQPSDSKQQGQPGQGGGQSGSQGDSDQNRRQSEPQDPADRATQRLRAAQQRMEEARKKLDEAERKGAAQQQREALKELEQAKAELERVLRQLREEELERTLTQLAARFRKMLEMQNAVYEGTVRVDRVPEPQRDHDDEIEAARLGRQQSQIVAEADKALLLLREEGSSVAFPEAVEQMREDMQQVAQRLSAVKVDVITQALEQDIIAALEEVIAALEMALKELEKNRTPPGQSPGAGQPAEQELVNKLAELKMIRSLQVRIYNRTKRYGEMIGGEQAEDAELIEALRELAERQRRVHQATADLQLGRND